MPAYELLLPLGALAFYLYDSTMLLYSNELLLDGGAARWRFNAGSNFFLAGKRLCLPNLLEPQRALFRVAWSETDRRDAQETPAQLQQFIAALRSLRPLVLLLLVLLLAGLPLSGLVFGAGFAMLAVIGAYYLVTIAGLIVVQRRRQALGLTTRDVLATAFDALACPPFAINLLRKLCLRRGIGGNALAFAADALQPPERAALLDVVAARVESELRGVDERTPRWQTLRAFTTYLQQLANKPAAELATCHPTK